MGRIAKYQMGEEIKRKIGDKAKKRWANRKFREMNISALKKSFDTPEYKRKMRIVYDSPKFRKLQAEKFTGSKNPRWNGGKTIHKGYLLIVQKDHPFATKHGYVREHRLVVEKELGRYLVPGEVIHHLGDKLDNRKEKLMAFSCHSSHIRFGKGKDIPGKHIIFDGRKFH